MKLNKIIDGKQEAIADLARANAVLALLKNNEFASSVSICGIELHLCNIQDLIPTVKKHKKEIKKFLKGKSNKWE